MKNRASKAVRLFGAPEPEKFRSTAIGKTLKDTAAIHFDPKDRKSTDRLLAAEKLALDILEDNLAARAFAVNPTEYLRRCGFTDTDLNLSSQEVRIAMAVGDPMARQAASKGDVDGFIDAVLAQGVQPEVGVGKFVHVEVLVHSSVVVYFIAAVVTFQKIMTATAVPIVVIGPPIVTSADHVGVLSRIADRIGDPAFAKRVASKRVEKTIAGYEKVVEKRLRSL